MNQPISNTPALNLRDIHLPEPVSWWPPAPGWWLLIAAIIVIVTAFFISRKIYRSKQLRRDIAAELDTIKKQFQQTGNKSQLACALSALLRRACISYYPAKNIAGLTGEDWLAYLDDSNTKATSEQRFQSETGKILLSAPYLPENARLDYDAQALLRLCESWLLSPHKNSQQVAS